MVCAGQSSAGMAFTARHADYSFCFGKGLNTPTAFAATAERLAAAGRETGRQVACYVLFMVIADETDDAAMARWEHYKAGADQEALDWMADQGSQDKSSGKDTNVRQMTDPTSSVNFNMGTLVGSYENVARMLDEIDTVEGVGGVMLTFDDFLEGLDTFGERVQPLMKTRVGVAGTAAPVPETLA